MEPTKEKSTKKPAATPSPFVSASSRDRRVKIFIFGDSGAGKTSTSLCFPAPVIVDLEQGSLAYAQDTEFDVLPSQSPDEVIQAVEWLARHSHNYKTLVIDPISVFWEALQKKWSDIFLARNRGSKGYRHEFYDMQVRDWNVIKGEFKQFLRTLLSLDVNVVVTARQKVKYADGEFMRQVGETFDGEKSLPYLFDVVLQFFRTEGGKFSFSVLKDRFRALPTKDVAAESPQKLYTIIERAFGRKNIERPAKPFVPITGEQNEDLRSLIHRFGLDPGAVASRLMNYGAEDVGDLSTEDAQTIIGKMQTALDAKEDAAVAAADKTLDSDSPG